MNKYFVIIEKAENNYSAFSPDMPGCITVGKTIEDTTIFIKEAIELYLESLADDGENMPSSKGLRYYIEQGIFEENQIAEEYFFAMVEVHLPKMAA